MAGIEVGGWYSVQGTDSATCHEYVSSVSHLLLLQSAVQPKPRARRQNRGEDNVGLQQDTHCRRRHQGQAHQHLLLA